MIQIKQSGGETLRERAEKLAAEKKYRQPDLMSPDDMQAALHELQVHQIELEMQNEELRRTQSEIESARARYFDLYEIAPVGYCTLSDKGMILEVNLTAAGLFGVARGELIGKPFSRYISKDDQDDYYLHKIRLFEKSEPQSFEIRMKRNGSFFWADIHATVVQGVDEQRICRITMSDISKRKLAEEAVIESEKKYQELIKYAPAGIYELDFRNNRYISVNDVMCELTGYAREEFLGSSPFDILDDNDKTKFRNRMERWLKGEEPEPNVDYKVKSKYGTDIYASLNVKFTRDENGKPLGATVIAHDVTERRNMEEALRESERKARTLVQELEKSDKNKDNFIGVLSHELRNPLAVIVAGLSLLEASENPEQNSKSKEIIKRQTNQLCKLVDDLLDLTRINQNKIKLKMETVNLNDILKNVVLDVQPEYNTKSILLNTEMPKEPVFLSADPVRITQCTGNLLQNALKYTQEAGHVTLSLATENGEAVIRVRDNGMGMNNVLLEHIFTPFMQADTSIDRTNGGGLGLGLSIVDGMVRLHGGSVTAFSKGTGKGSLFTIRLPISVQAADTQRDTAVNESDRTYNILLIEDNANLAYVLLSLFSLMGHKAHAAYNGAEGISEARKIRPDVIFCDIGLPGLSGYEVAKVLKADGELKSAFLIALSGYASEDDIKRAREAGFDRHLAKPVDMTVLEKILAEI